MYALAHQRYFSLSVYLSLGKFFLPVRTTAHAKGLFFFSSLRRLSNWYFIEIGKTHLIWGSPTNPVTKVLFHVNTAFFLKFNYFYKVQLMNKLILFAITKAIDHSLPSRWRECWKSTYFSLPTVKKLRFATHFVKRNQKKICNISNFYIAVLQLPWKPSKMDISSFKMHMTDFVQVLICAVKVCSSW